METAEESGRLPNANACLRRALSVFRSEQDAEHQARLFRRWKRKYVAQATLRSDHGDMMPTDGQQPSHTSWWPATNLGPADRAALFHALHEVQV
jgi:hypothetical protein